MYMHFLYCLYSPGSNNRVVVINLRYLHTYQTRFF